MDGHDRQRRVTLVDIERGLSELRAPRAPATLLPNALMRCGLCDLYWRLPSPVGAVWAAHNEEGVSAVMRVEDEAEFEELFRERHGRNARRVEPPARLAREVRRLLEGDMCADVRFDLRGVSEFERAVLLKALEIPYGEVRPYGWVAREIGRPGATRAVGSALGRNPIPLLIPCHRVVRTDGRIGEYALGSGVKRAALAAEGAEPELLERLARSGVRYLADPETGTYCFPTCGGEHKRADALQPSFRTAAEACEAGYQPCPVCRPALAS
jgi:O-6-methylguanine DNA methyltransferase